MSHFSEVTRPAMRRKSSAQTLLSSFKSATSSSQSVNTLPTVPPPIQTNSGTISSVTGMNITAVLASASTPTATTPLGRGDSTEYAENVVASLVGATSPPLGSHTSVEFLRELVQKRLVTLTYIRNVHEGRSHWFHTLLITRADLEREFNNEHMKKRTYRFAILGFSLSNLLDINNPQDLLRGLLNIVTEFDRSEEESDKIKRMFRKGAKKGAASNTTEYTGSELTMDASYLMTPQMPFALDYHETVVSLLDVVSEVYNKISKILGPSSLPYPSHILGPLTSVTPYPGVSYLFASEANNHSNQYPNTTLAYPALQQSQFHNSSSNPNLHQPVRFPSVSGSSTTLTGSLGSGDNDACNSLWSIANASSVGMGMGVGFPQPTISWSATQSDTILKIDAKLKKVSSVLLKDLDMFTRKGIVAELASLPLLKNSVVSDDPTLSNGSGKSLYDYDG
ncbi:hypothetical protein P691DRAFT_813422 [Macrolepiota fuliginosa MF-IS2]|uniref:Uncharacterized protein n=1 Tax=Macrolepiota fuliginosa MF-IS2 TaxID=1400762 RepID=A0A9P6C565_9AGAR|nr:hypothetical protein P691DRAFT_813422 [Macrolepiota fuliginosa MF-IS2]